MRSSVPLTSRWTLCGQLSFLYAEAPEWGPPMCQDSTETMTGVGEWPGQREMAPSQLLRKSGHMGREDRVDGGQTCSHPKRSAARNAQGTPFVSHVPSETEHPGPGVGGGRPAGAGRGTNRCCGSRCRREPRALTASPKWPSGPGARVQHWDPGVGRHPPAKDGAATSGVAGAGLGVCVPVAGQRHPDRQTWAPRTETRRGRGEGQAQGGPGGRTPGLHFSRGFRGSFPGLDSAAPSSDTSSHHFSAFTNLFPVFLFSL